MSSVERLPEQWFQPVRLSFETFSLRPSERRRPLVPWRMVTVLVFLAVALSGRRANSDEVELSSIAVPSTETVSISEYYRKYGMWLLPATMNNQPAMALLGTGSNIVTVHAPNGPNSFPNVGVRIPPSIANPVTIFADMPFQCLGLPKKSDFAMGYDFKSLQDYSHFRVTAIAGMPYLRDYAFVLDPSNAKIEVVSSPVKSAAGVRLAITWKDEVPHLPVTFPIIGTREIVLETGSAAEVRMSQERADALERMGQLRMIKLPLARQGSNGLEDDVPTNLCVLRFLEFAEIRFHNVPVIISDKDKIGLGLLEHFRTTLDFPTGQVWCAKLKVDEDIELLPPTFACAPCFFFQNARELEVVASNEYFPNADHRLKIGDRVLKLNGRDPKHLAFADLQEILSKAGTTVSLEMQRGERRFPVDLKLELPYPWPPKWESERVTFDQDFEASLK
ncbi:MAG: PDZ domain-containing protein [Planctomycetaceae bacterium]